MERYALERGDYFELRSRTRDVELVELEAMKAAQQFARQAMDAAKVKSDLYEALAKKYEFDPKQTYAFEDATLELVAQG